MKKLIFLMGFLSLLLTQKNFASSLSYTGLQTRSIFNGTLEKTVICGSEFFVVWPPEELKAKLKPVILKQRDLNVPDDFLDRFVNEQPIAIDYQQDSHGAIKNIRFHGKIFSMGIQGFGFISHPLWDENIHFRYRDIPCSMRRALRRNKKVTFSLKICKDYSIRACDVWRGK